ncbi:barren [Aulographum hederae CBS 113979]|uniref:Condensin complex subunit 2 n=1 Tax=Aulographum hederae CBS 113979 TaxID=1176131 RepID=A0A6G1H3U1_9PEZI|nr:barren [Aulographum hederae CBS 113979]
MPRVASNPLRGRDMYATAATPGKTPMKSPMKIPLNDDRQEKANRLLSRQAVHEEQMNQIKAAATPLRKRRSLLAGSPHTPADLDDNGLNVSGSAVTPMKRVPILANFEEWMKMATDNKINAANSWNFALIDYFHDMSLLKEGDGVNFQKASCTLDGCVKIYTSRVDSVATETGKLLSGLADSREKKGKKDGEEGEGDEEDEEGEEGEDGVKKRKKRTQRSSEATLATSFAQLQLKKMELEFSVDPLFKKASADFDEGGAKGLLLNHLAIDGKGRIVFDSSDDAQDMTAEDRRESALPDVPEEEEEVSAIQQEADIDMSALAAKFFPDLSLLDEQHICPSLKDFDLSDPNAALDLPMLKAPEDWRDDRKDPENGVTGDNTGLLLGDDNPLGFDDDDDDGGLGNFDLPPDTGFGEGGEAWAREAALEPQMRIHNGLGPAENEGDGEGEDGAFGDVGGYEPANPKYAVTLSNGKDDHENILNYFDQALQKNWAGPEHWKIRKIKDVAKAAATGPTKRKEKEPFVIDFDAPLTQSMADALYTQASSNSTISLPKAQWKSRTRNLLPDDKHFNSRQLLRLFLKPKARLGTKKSSNNNQSSSHQQQKQQQPEGEVDEAYWAAQNAATDENAADGSPAPKGDYDANFFADDDPLNIPLPMDDDDDMDDEFADAREQFSPAREGEEMATQLPAIAGMLAQAGGEAYGDQLVMQSRRLRPEYVQYARVAKKVDVRRLKEEIWKGTGFEDTQPTPQQPQDKPTAPAETETLKFTDIVRNLQSVYPAKQMSDISTSYCFICLLHLANEKGLVIENQPGWTDLSVRRDLTAEIAGPGE